MDKLLESWRAASDATILAAIREFSPAPPKPRWYQDKYGTMRFGIKNSTD